MADKKASAFRFKTFTLVFLLFGPAFLLIFISTRGCEHKFKELDDMGKVPSYSFVDANSKKYTNKSFQNKVVLFTTIQLTCPDSCSISMWHFDQLIYQHLRKNQKKLKHLKIVSFVVDEKGNPVQDLKLMESILEEQIEEYDPKIWILASGDPKAVFNITRNGENLLKDSENTYSSLLLLVDKANHLRMVLKGNSEGMVRRMKQHMALLDKEYDKKAAKQEK
jgi:cytochrome oxidase Cu insertion factor (SCO1/SenC/PrrC family)